MQPAARISDMHVCPMATPGTPPVPHVGGPISLGAATVIVGMMPAARVGDMCVCVGPPDTIAMGSPTVQIEMRPAARMGDNTAHGGVISSGCPTVLIGGAGMGPGGLPISFAGGKVTLGSSIVIEGTPEFQAKVIERLTTIASTPSGMQMLLNVDTSGQTLTITEFTGPNSFAGPDSFQDATAAGQPVFDGAGNPVNNSAGTQQNGTGNGSDVTVQFNPSLTLPNSSDPTNPMPNDAILFHEMQHGSNQMNGTYDGTPVPGWTTQEEQNTISTGNPSEADYLRERGYPWQRNSHGTTWIPNP